jgi:hypothetical protein
VAPSATAKAASNSMISKGLTTTAIGCPWYVSTIRSWLRNARRANSPIERLASVMDRKVVVGGVVAGGVPPVTGSSFMLATLVR